jgi:hypothetical protein
MVKAMGSDARVPLQPEDLVALFVVMFEVGHGDGWKSAVCHCPMIAANFFLE